LALYLLQHGGECLVLLSRLERGSLELVYCSYEIGVQPCHRFRAFISEMRCSLSVLLVGLNLCGERLLTKCVSALHVNLNRFIVQKMLLLVSKVVLAHQFAIKNL
jgi:hypothetical protein